MLWYQRGYQNKDTATSASTIKLKGVAMTNYSQLNISIHGGADGIRIWDVADYVIPPQVRTQSITDSKFGARSNRDDQETITNCISADFSRIFERTAKKGSLFRSSYKSSAIDDLCTI